MSAEIVAKQMLDVDTPAGPGRVEVREAVNQPGTAAHQAGTAAKSSGAGAEPLGTLAIGHGAGGGCGAVDIQRVAGAAVAAGWQVLLVSQPWLVAGRRVAAPPPQLDVAWLATLRDSQVEAIRLRAPGARLVVAGRSAGARVACRTAVELGAVGVCCLAFPLHPPGKPERSRLDELRRPIDAGLPVLVVQGERDAFGGAAELAAAVAISSATAGNPATQGRLGPAARAAPQFELAAVPGDHALKADPAAVAAAVTGWLSRLPGSDR